MQSGSAFVAHRPILYMNERAFRVGLLEDTVNNLLPHRQRHTELSSTSPLSVPQYRLISSYVSVLLGISVAADYKTTNSVLTATLLLPPSFPLLLLLVVLRRRIEPLRTPLLRPFLLSSKVRTFSLFVLLFLPLPICYSKILYSSIYQSAVLAWVYL